MPAVSSVYVPYQLVLVRLRYKTSLFRTYEVMSA